VQDHVDSAARRRNQEEGDPAKAGLLPKWSTIGRENLIEKASLACVEVSREASLRGVEPRGGGVCWFGTKWKGGKNYVSGLKTNNPNLQTCMEKAKTGGKRLLRSRRTNDT